MSSVTKPCHPISWSNVSGGEASLRGPRTSDNSHEATTMVLDPRLVAIRTMAGTGAGPRDQGTESTAGQAGTSLEHTLHLETTGARDARQEGRGWRPRHSVPIQGHPVRRKQKPGMLWSCGWGRAPAVNLGFPSGGSGWGCGHGARGGAALEAGVKVPGWQRVESGASGPAPLPEASPSPVG